MPWVGLRLRAAERALVSKSQVDSTAAKASNAALFVPVVHLRGKPTSLRDRPPPVPPELPTGR
jgi:hypothetical protein